MDGKVLIEVLPDTGEVRTLSLGDVDEAVASTAGELKGALWSIDCERIDELMELAEDGGFEVWIL